ncbi:MAG: hypothetical protein GX444_14080 [Myxococcales bacterium]|nr:hypothetical protein [Myxococcales bacterium]
MTELLKCPSCGGPMQLGEFKPGDKIAKCPYCGKVVDLPDDQTTQKVTEIEEHSQDGKARMQRKVKVTETKSTAAAGAPDNAEINDLLAQVRQTFEKSAASANPGAGIKGVVNQQTVKTSFTTTVTRSGAGEVQLPDEVKKLIQNLGVEMPEGAGKVTIVQEAVTAPEKKPGLLKRLFGKKE